MKWFLVFGVVGSTVACDLLQSWDMKGHGEVADFRPASIAGWFRRWPLILAVAFMAVSFFSFIQLLAIADLSFAVPVTAANIVFETLLARMILKEKVHVMRWLGAVFVAAGITLLAGT